ncbi:MAG: carboxypeptidase regulatory-like domain-containing protein [Alphaproteobacteria bacterium]|nr:carboxypeptidase regulatory-like domain-containing protein [Alphaproteobacteria bacterium]
MHTLVHPRLPLLCGALLALAGCVQSPAARNVALSTPIPAGAARLWFYRSYEPSVSLNDARVSLNGTPTVTVGADGTPVFRDVPPGTYHLTVESFGQDTNQAKDIALAPGQEGFAKILASDSWSSDGGVTQITRDTFYVSLVSPQVARSELGVASPGG